MVLKHDVRLILAATTLQAMVTAHVNVSSARVPSSLNYRILFYAREVIITRDGFKERAKGTRFGA